MRTALVGVLEEFQLSPLILEPSNGNDTCTPVSLPPLTQDTSHPLFLCRNINDDSILSDKNHTSVAGITARGVDSFVRITEFESPSSPLTNFEIKYANAQRKLYNLEVNLGLNTLSDRERILNMFR